MVKQTGYSIFAHSCPLSRAPRLLPLFNRIFYLEYRQKNPLKYNILSLLLLLATCHLLLVTAVNAEPPDRIISLAPNLTEILFAMGLGERVIGVTNFCDYPEDAKRKPKIGGMYNPSLEAVISLRPDIVVMTTDGNLKDFEERLRSLRIKTYVFKARRISELPRGIRDMGSALGVKDKAEALAKEIEDGMNRSGVKSQESGLNSRKKKVLFIIWPEPLIVAGSGTAIDDAINLLGCENIASKANTSYPRYSVEETVRQAPDVIFIGKGHTDIKVASEKIIGKLSGTPAVKHGEVYYVTDSIYRLSPRIVGGIDEMAQCLK